MPVKFFRLIFSCGWHILGCYFRWIHKYSRHPERYPIEVRYAAARELITFVMKRMRIRLELNGFDNFLNQKGGFLVAPNHLSMMDVLFDVALSDRPLTFVAKIEAKKMPFIGSILTAMDGLFLDRNDLRQNAIIMREVGKRFSEGKIIVIYPEGTRQKNHRAPLLPFHPGTFKVAAKAGVPILPIAEYGTFRLFDIHHDYRQNLVQMTFFPPVMPEEYTKASSPEVAAMIQQKVQIEVNRQRELDDQFMKSRQQHEKLTRPFWYEAFESGEDK